MIISKDLLVLGEYIRLPKNSDTHIQCQVADGEDSCDLVFINIHTTCGDNFALKEISGIVKPGEVLAVMGPTGCGKTSLLNALAGRLKLNGGSVRLNGVNMSKRVRRTRIGYVLQHDVFFADLTLKQTLVYTALLRLPDRTFTKAEKLKKVDEIIDMLDLRRCQDTIVGDVMKRGLSGGEKKRLSIACELITNPSVLLIDEPTSGLDSCTASHLMSLLKDYALKERKSVVLAVHQPSSRMFHQFDRLLLLSEGQPAYFGEACNVISHFSSLGLQIAANYNPADFVLEELKGERTKVVEGWKMTIEGLLGQKGSEILSQHELMRVKSEPNDSWPTSTISQISVLAARNFREARPRMLSKLNWLQTFTLAAMAGLVWLKTERKEESLTDLEGWMFFSTNYWMLFALFGALTAFPSERAVVEKERASGAYRLSAYYIAKMIGEAPLVMVLPSVYLLVSYPLIGGSSAAFFGSLGVQILASLASQSAGLFFGACLSMNASITAAAIFTLAAQLLGGYLANNIPVSLKSLSLVYHSYRNMQLLEFNIGEEISCGNVTRFPSCANGGLFVPPEELLGRDELDLPYWAHTVFLFAFLVLFRALGYIALRKTL